MTDLHTAGVRLGPSGWQLLRDSTCQRGLNRSQPKRRGCGKEQLTPRIPAPGVFFLSSHRLLSEVGVGFDWRSLCTSGRGFANSRWSRFVAFIDNSNVLIIGDSLVDCESSRKEHIAVQNVPLTLTCTHPPIFFPSELLSVCLSIPPLLLCVCRGTRSSRAAERVLQTKASRSAPQELPDVRVKLHKTQDFLGVQSQGWSPKLN